MVFQNFVSKKRYCMYFLPVLFFFMVLCQMNFGHHLEAFRNYSKTAVTLASWISMDAGSLVEVLREARFWSLFAAVLFSLTTVFFLTNVFLGILVNLFWRYRIKFACANNYDWDIYQYIDWMLPRSVLACFRTMRKRYRRRQEELRLRKAEQEAALAKTLVLKPKNQKTNVFIFRCSFLFNFQNKKIGRTESSD